MSIASDYPIRPLPLGVEAYDADDGIHIASVTRVDRPDGPVLRAVVSWFEDGQWVERTFELPDG